MTLDDVPSYLQGPVGALGIWAGQSNPTRFLIVQGPNGSGRHHWIERVLRDRGIVPVHRYDESPCPPENGEGRPLVPLYHPGKIETPPTTRSIVIVESSGPVDRKIVGEKGELAVVATFEAPPRYALEMFLERNGVPARLAEGNPSYAACRQAILAWRMAGVEIRQVETDPENWSGFRQGGSPPVEGALLGYYCAENLPKTYWTWNRALRMIDRGRVPARFADIGLDEIRAMWPQGTPRFPAVLAVPKAKKGDQREPPAPRRVASGETGAERSTPIVWP